SAAGRGGGGWGGGAFFDESVCAGGAGAAGAVVSAGCASAGAAANSISAMMAMRAMRDNGETVVIVARQHTSARHAGEACPIVMAGLDGRSSLPGLTRQSIRLRKYPRVLRRMMDPRVKPAGDDGAE